MRRRQFITYGGLALLSACTAGNEAPKNSPAQITFWTMQLKPTFEQYMTGVIQEFTNQNPNAEVQWVDVPWAEMETKILGAITSNSAPDVVNLNPQFASKLAERNALVDMAQFLPPDQQSLYFPNLWRANQLNGTTFALPWYVATDITIYNRQLFTKAGLNPDQPPRTYAELQTVSRQIRDRTGKYAFLLTMDGGQVLESMVQMGMTLLTPEGKAGFNTPAGESAFAYWVELFHQGLVPREILTEGHRKAIALYQAGEIAILLTGPQFLQMVAENAPDIAKVTDVAPQITGSTGKKSAAVMNVAVPITSPHRELAVKFAQFLTNDQNQLKFAQLRNILPSTVKAAQDNYFRKVKANPSLSDRARVISASQLAQAEVLIPPVQGIDNLRRIIYDELQLAMLRQKTVKEAIASAEQRWNERQKS
jgi:putative chitobiose transport system substrate-binding protein